MDPSISLGVKEAKRNSNLSISQMAAPRTTRKPGRIITQAAITKNKERSGASTSGSDWAEHLNLSTNGQTSGNNTLSQAKSTFSSPIESDQAFIHSSPLTSQLSPLTATPSPPIYAPAKSAKPRGITTITISEADLQSSPTKGPVLTALVDAAKDAGEIPQFYDSSVIRRINNVWLAPQKCKSCQRAGKPCDRVSPCTLCKDSDCKSNGFMIKIPKTKVSPKQTSTDHISADQGNSQNRIQDGSKSRSGQKRKHEDTDFNKGASAKKRQQVGTYYKNVQKDKPEPFGIPPVWSETRQGLCEAVPYYRAYQSGAYLNGGIVHGFLCDKEASKRAKFDDTIMIATVGGGKSEDESGSMVQLEGVKRSVYSTSFTNTMNAHLPVAVIAGQGNPLSPCQLPNYYSVLGWFHVTDVWCEKSTENTHGGRPLMRWLVRLEKIDLTTTSWWAPKFSLDPPAAPDFNVKAATACCLSCLQESKSIYNAGWACLNNNCVRFFEFGSEINHDTLDISHDFIHERNPYTGKAPSPITPPVPTLQDVAFDQASKLNAELARAIVCPKCHGCIEKRFWYDWECKTPGCEFKHSIIPSAISVGEAVSGSQKGKLSLKHLNYHNSIRGYKAAYGGYDSDLYLLPDAKGKICGVVVHMKSSSVINQQPGGPNDLFEMMQDRVFKLKRGFIKGGENATNRVLTNHYSANWGAPYKYHVKNKSTSFEDSPDAVILILSRLSRAAERIASSYNKTYLPENFMPFNEILTIGYKADNKINYHDDGERELGPTVASISLGCSATMTWRPAAKAWGDLRPAKNSKINNSKQDDVAQNNPKQEAFAKKSSKTCEINNPQRLKIVLHHGDMMVMHGEGIQSNYEHAVTPDGKLRFAITGRHIKISSLPAEIQDEARKAGTVPAHRQLPAYNGDEFAKEVEVQDDLFEHLNRVYLAKVDVGEGSLKGCLEASKRLVESLEQRMRVENGEAQ